MPLPRPEIPHTEKSLSETPTPAKPSEQTLAKLKHYKNPPADMVAILKHIARVSMGAKMLTDFLPLLSQRKVRFERYPKALVQKLKRSLTAEDENRNREPTGGCLVVHAQLTAVIHYDATESLGALIPIIFHEICHALDKRLWESRLSIEIKVATEIDAFAKQYQLIDSLRARDEIYDLFLRTHYAQSRLLKEPFTPDEIRRLYGDERKAA